MPGSTSRNGVSDVIFYPLTELLGDLRQTGGFVLVSWLWSGPVIDRDEVDRNLVSLIVPRVGLLGLLFQGCRTDFAPSAHSAWSRSRHGAVSGAADRCERRQRDQARLDSVTLVQPP